MNIQDYIEALRKQVKFLEDNGPLFRAHNIGVYGTGYLTDELTAEVSLSTIAKIVAAIPGTWKKGEMGANLTVTHKETGFYFMINRSLDTECHQEPTGRKVTVRKPRYEFDEVEEDEMKWVCPPILSQATDS